MLFNSAAFLFAFLPVTLAGYFLVLRFLGKLPSQLWLFLASLFFYGWWNPKYVALIIGSMLFNYYLGRYLLLNQDRKALILGIAANLAVLGYYKYTGLLVATTNQLTGADFIVPNIILPLGISFFTFQKIAFLVDCHRKLAAPNQSLINFGLFITFFPQLIAGPIVHHKEMMPQFAKPRSFDPGSFAVGLTLLSIGLFKKVMIADTLDAYVGPLFKAAESRPLHIIEAWAAALAYTFQIYFDFSGYSDMALGLGKMFNVRLPVNFFSPYKAKNIIDFWRRWHMTLSRFLRDYLYIPLGGNRKGNARRYLNLMITMLLGGFWHGANWTFLVWGGLHGAFLGINHAWQQAGMPRLPGPLAAALTFLCVMIAWIFFRAGDLHTAVSITGSLVDFSSMKGQGLYDALLSRRAVLRSSFDAPDANFFCILIPLAAAICWVLPNSIEIMRRGSPCIGSTRGLPLASNKLARALSWQPGLATGLLGGVILSICIAKVVYEPSQVFLYFQF
ncbi:MAG TPA: MBOAT family protein [Patescibacteria group bacterium]|nr:MBOAT family protein [Patescibacteria group bacterium]